MPEFYKIDKERRLILTTGSGVLTLADAVSHMDKLSKDQDFDPNFSQIVDFTQVTRIELSADDIRRLAQRTIFSPSSRRAFIAPDEVAFGIGRMFQILRGLEGEKGIRVFRTSRKRWTGCSLKGRRPEGGTCAPRHNRWI
ncbi:MAG TPA: hypothetical protein VGR55_14395 [Candidatus Acidoferrum sp.]|nr:hypothetical protein [Candidatus Acidoferrum sp.]